MVVLSGDQRKKDNTVSQKDNQLNTDQDSLQWSAKGKADIRPVTEKPVLSCEKKRDMVISVILFISFVGILVTIVFLAYKITLYAESHTDLQSSNSGSSHTHIIYP